ncbi:hypothetical protein PLEOSDRAFT_1090862 [Pleurotus ostreatus PC15]|uniref:Uncharacterized protein n=1 Tax=Pleurotus ostreatus (strain PC15) TaxID=1137138 RepID=A0A067N5Z6_PLEO1|nr:hypothetical protein PLEOSDRAFT_1090862 [Pleurotus ostreatus PC15]
MTSSKIVFPPPPPTTNSLTSQQRKQLQRSTKKLGRMLGSTPQLIDEDAYGIDLYSTGPFIAYRDEPYPFHRGSMDSLTSSSSSSSSSGSSSSRSTSRSTSPASVFGSPSSTRSETSLRSARSCGPRSRTRPPLMRIGFNSAPCLAIPSLETIPSSPTSPEASFGLSRASSFKIDETKSCYTLHHSRTPSPRDSLIEPDFVIPSQNTLRRQKMDRLRRKLGDEVPLSLVFPRQRSLDDSDDEDILRPSLSRAPSVRLRVAAPPPPPVPSSSPSKCVRSSSRDSLTLPSVHRANRSKRIPVPAYDASLPTTYTSIRISPPTCVPPPRASSLRASPPKDRSLCSIVECPDEHGSGCAEEFSLFGSAMPLTAGRAHPYASSASPYTEPESSKLWSTRRGYEGWGISL